MYDDRPTKELNFDMSSAIDLTKQEACREQIDGRNQRAGVRRCRECGCTDDDCSGCIARTGRPCHWVAADLCSACASGK